MAERVAGEATILESVYDPGRAGRDAVDQERDQGPIGLLADRVAGLPYALLLEVRAPGVPDTQVRWTGRVPDKVERLGLFDHIRVPVSLIVPVTVDPERPGEVQIEWKAFLARPDRVELTKAAARRAQAAEAGAPPASGLDQQDEATRLMIFRVAKQVREGQVPRAQLETMCQQLMQVGQLSAADSEAALAVADGR